MDKDRATFYKSVTAYDPKQSKTVTQLVELATYPCMATGLSNKRQLETFGNLTSADAVIRLINKDITGVTNVLINSKKYKVAKISDYQTDQVVYIKEVQAW